MLDLVQFYTNVLSEGSDARSALNPTLCNFSQFFYETKFFFHPKLQLCIMFPIVSMSIKEFHLAPNASPWAKTIKLHSSTV